MMNSEILSKLEALRAEYPSASEERREEIKTEAEVLKAQLRKCYQCGKELPDNHPSYFCSQTHKDEYWGGQKRPTARPMTLDEMRKALEQMKREKELARHVGQLPLKK
jgi:DNA repair exonuclease SbcCD ATPase subunit